MTRNAFLAIQSDLENLNAELNRQCLAIRKGRQDTQRTGAIFAEHDLAASSDSVLFLKGMMDGEEDDDLRERASRLYYACITQFIRKDLLMMDDTLRPS